MGGILDKLDEWLRGLLIEGITGNLSGMFDTVNTKVGEIAGEVGQTPLAWNSGVFSMIRNLSETVIVPIAGVILTFVMCYELIQLVTEKNNLHDVDTWMFFKWIFKTFCAVLIVTNTWNIVRGIFDVGQSVVNSSAGVIIGNTSIDIGSVITDMEAQLEALGTGELFGLWFQSLFVGLTMNALSICIMLVLQGSARPPVCNSPRKNVPIPHLESTSTVPTVRRIGWTRQRPLSPQRKFSVPSVFLTRQPEKAKRSFTLKKWRNAPTDDCGTIRFPDRSMRSSTPPMRRCMRWNRKTWVLRLDTRARC